LRPDGISVTKLDTPMSNLLLTILLKSGVQIEKIGDSTSPSKFSGALTV